MKLILVREITGGGDGGVKIPSLLFGYIFFNEISLSNERNLINGLTDALF